MKETLIYIAEQFTGGTTILDVKKFGKGHIHQTWLVFTSSGKIILQQFNQAVFKDARAVMSNIAMLTEYLTEVLAPPFCTLNFIKSSSGSYYHRDANEQLWRAYHFIDNSKTYSTAPNEKIPREAGLAYGEFLAKTSQLNIRDYKVAINDFHNMAVRWKQYLEAKNVNYKNRISEAEKEIFFLEKNIQRVLEFERENLKLPIHIIHNDPKIDNVLFDEDDRGICVIDLDTVMPGYLFNDFGDAIRTLANTALEDEKEVSKVVFNLKYFSAFSKGFLIKMKKYISEDEKSSLLFAPYFMTYIIGLRFLADYLSGDTYYQIKYPDHNLIRARVQIEYLKRLDENEYEIAKVINSL